MKTIQATPPDEYEQWEQTDDRALVGAAHSAAAMAVTAQHFGTVVRPAIQRIYGPLVNQSLRWEAGFQIQQGARVLEPALEGIVNAVGLLSRAVGESEYDSLNSAQFRQRIHASADWYMETMDRIGGFITILRNEGHRISACTLDLINQGVQVAQDDCCVLKLSDAGMRALTKGRATL